MLGGGGAGLRRAKLLGECSLEPLFLQVSLGPGRLHQLADQPDGEAQEDQAGQSELEEEVQVSLRALFLQASRSASSEAPVPKTPLPTGWR